MALAVIVQWTAAVLSGRASVAAVANPPPPLAPAYSDRRGPGRRRRSGGGIQYGTWTLNHASNCNIFSYS